jgi:hypothetical protein
MGFRGVAERARPQLMREVVRQHHMSSIRTGSSLALLATACATSATAQARWPADAELHQVTREAAVPAPTCTAQTPTLTPDSLGPLRPGQTLHDVEHACPHLYYAWDWGYEAIPEPVAVVRLGDVQVMLAFHDTTSSSTAYRISTASQLARTTEGLGPGSQLSELIQAWGEPRFGVGECVLYAWFPSQEGLSFRLQLPGPWDCTDLFAMEDTGDWSRVPTDARVRYVLLVGQ